MTQKRDYKTGQYTFSKEAPPTPATTPAKETSAKKTRSVRKPKTIIVKARYGKVEIPTNEITEDTRWVYQNGQCFSLAAVLAETNQTDIGLLVARSKIPWGTRYEDTSHKLNANHDWFKDSIHAIALAENSTADDAMTLDIDGERDMGAVREEFIDLHCGSMIRIKPEDLRMLLSKFRRGTGFYEPDYASAEIIAPLVPRD